MTELKTEIHSETVSNPNKLSCLLMREGLPSTVIFRPEILILRVEL
ncbi:hypothetical protein ALQ57_200082 [Pseudomonas amygdali pv. hibisci]|uniref:Peptidase, U61 family protein n=1 Tax=Pseudomonas amygdali pv. mori TaxID=34065 RepID=A0A0P9WDF3_PSEA0|nr:hypothetical protein ALO63_200089 [Pseudomonas amygdali pv. mori]RMN55371.1 hypothetical protein ALQ57_200082 [Pseudomonas amygdali pv. hibisci]